jgi:hypothetical protein
MANTAINKNEADESVLLTHDLGKPILSTVPHQWCGEAKLNPHSFVYSLPVANIFVYVKLQSWQYNFINTKAWALPIIFPFMPHPTTLPAKRFITLITT